MSEWNNVALKDITELVIDYRGKTPLKLGGEWSSRRGYRALSAKNVKTGIIVAEDSIRFVDEELYKKWMKEEVQRGDILITSEAPFGEVFFWNSDEKIVLSQRLFDVRVKKSVCPQYVYYYMTSYPFQAELRSRASGTTVLGLKQPELLKSIICLPDYETQEKIASILSSLDDKIAVNRRICENLEAQAQALFKHWFIDFAPFKDGKFVESELGMIPEGWKVGKLSEIADLIKATITPQTNICYSHYSIPAFDNNQTPSHDIGDSIKSNKFAIQDSVIMLSKLNPEHKRIWFVDKVDCNAVCSTEFLPLYAKNKEQSVFIYCYLNCPQNYREIANGAKGTTNSHQRIDANAVLSRKLAYDNDAVTMFSKLVGDFMKQKDIAVQESSRLSTLRDTLLPKLMSGQIKV